VEVYRNTFTGDDSRGGVCYMRGGTGLIWSNTISGWTAGACFNLLDNRSTDHENAPFNGSDGRNPWDKNNAGNPFATGTASSAGTLTVTDSGKSWTVNQWAGYVVRKTSGKAVSSLTRSGTTCTVTATAHGFTNNAPVSIYGANQYPYNGIFTITVVDANTFTFSMDWTPATPATGTIKACIGNNFGAIDSNTGTQLTFADSVASTQKRLVFTAGDTYEINKVDQSFDQCGVTGGSDLGGVDTPSVPGGWNDQTVSAWHEWGNTREGGANVDFTNGRSGGTYAVIVAGVHFTNDTAKASYTPYTYPHPLTVATEASTRAKREHPGAGGRRR
jgi:hypothetical protein